MRLGKEMSIRDFELWGGAVDFYSRLKDYEIDLLDDYFNKLSYYELLDATDINDMLSFDDEFFITAILKEDYDDYYKRKPLR